MSKIFSKHPSKIFYINIIADPQLKNDSSRVLVRDFCLKSCDDRYSFLSTQVSLVNKIICGDERNQKYFLPFGLKYFQNSVCNYYAEIVATILHYMSVLSLLILWQPRGGGTLQCTVLERGV